jgi:hypothetical protein
VGEGKKVLEAELIRVGLGGNKKPDLKKGGG